MEWTRLIITQRKEKDTEKSKVQSCSMSANAAASRDGCWEEQMLVPGSHRAMTFHQQLSPCLSQVILYVCLISFLLLLWQSGCGEGLDRDVRELSGRRSTCVAPMPFNKKQNNHQVNTGDRGGRWQIACADKQVATASVWSCGLKAFPEQAFLWWATGPFLQWCTCSVTPVESSMHGWNEVQNAFT